MTDSTTTKPSSDGPRDVAVILAAGKGTRMKSPLPKVLHKLGGRALVHHPIAAATAANIGEVVVVVGHGREQVEAELRPDHPGLRFVHQAEQRGTGHAVLCALSSIPEDADRVVILSGDVPLLETASIQRLLDAVQGDVSLAVLTFIPDDPDGYGRILREGGRVLAIREQKDASPAELEIKESNAGVYCAKAQLLRDLLPQLKDDNAQGELYLTDLVEETAKRSEVVAFAVDPMEVAGVNTQEQLAELEREYQKRQSAAPNGSP